MLYPRQIYPRLEAELGEKEVTVITGMRRVGKTTALNHLFNLVTSANRAIFDLENPLQRKVFEAENYDTVWNNLRQFGITNKEKAYLFVDEVQNLPELSRVVKYLYDHWQVKFVLTGSSSYYLRHLFPESLAGRKVVFDLFPLSFAEFLVFKQVTWERGETFAEKAKIKSRVRYEQLIPYYREYLEYGGFPSVVLEENVERKKVLLSEIFTSYFEKDAKNLADFKDMSKLRDLILLLVPRIAGRVDVAKLAAELAISRETVYSYLSFLEQTYFISLVPKYSASIDRRAAGSKKLFWCDSGLAGILGKASLGQLFEQSVFSTLRGGPDLHFYSREGGAEIDFIVDGNVALEVKLGTSRRDMANLRQRSQGIGIGQYYVVANHYSDDERVIPAVEL